MRSSAFVTRALTMVWPAISIAFTLFGFSSEKSTLVSTLYCSASSKMKNTLHGSWAAVFAVWLQPLISGSPQVATVMVSRNLTVSSSPGSRGLSYPLQARANASRGMARAGRCLVRPIEFGLAGSSLGSEPATELGVCLSLGAGEATSP